MDHQPISEAAQTLSSGDQCELVAIESEDLQPFVTFEQPFGVASTTKGRVQHHTCRYWLEHLRDLVGHHREVVERLGHRTPSRCRSLICSPPAADVAGMSPRSDETEAGGVGAVHLARRKTADERADLMIRFVGQFVALLLSLKFDDSLGDRIARVIAVVTPALRRCCRCRLLRRGRIGRATTARAW